MVSGLTIVTGLSCLPSISLLSSALSKHWAVGRGQPLPWALCDSEARAWNTVARSSRGVAAWLLCLEVRDEQIRWPGCLRGLLGAFSDSDLGGLQTSQRASGRPGVIDMGPWHPHWGS